MRFSVNLTEVEQTKHVIIVFETFSLLVWSIVNKHLHLNFSFPNTGSAVNLAKDKFLTECVRLQKSFWLWMYPISKKHWTYFLVIYIYFCL